MIVSTTDGDVKITINNIGGLSHFDKTITKGLNVIEEPNAFGKTSFLRAMSLLVSTSGNHADMSHVLKLHEKDGSISIENPSGSYTKTIERKSNTMAVAGDDLFEEGLSQMIKNYAIGGSDNEILTAIRDGKNLKDLLTNDFNTEMMKVRIAESADKEKKLKNEVAELNEADSKLPGLITNKEKKEKEIIELKKEKEIVDEEVKQLLQNADENDEITEQFKQLSQELISVNNAISQTKTLLDKDERNLKLAKERKATLEKELKQKDDGESEKEKTLTIPEIKSEVKTLKASLSPLENTYSAISLFIDGTKKMLAEITPVGSEPAKSDLLSSLSNEDMVLCPCCGNKTTTEELKAQLENYIIKAGKTKTEIDSAKSEIKRLEKEEEDIVQRQAEQADQVAKIAESKTAISDLLSNIAERKAALIVKEEEKKAIESDKDIVSKKLDTKQQELTYRQEELNQLIGQLENEIANSKKIIADYMKKKELLPVKQEELAEAKKYAGDCRAALTHKEKRLVKQFNEAIKNVYTSLKLDVNFHEIKLTPGYDIVISRQSTDGTQPLDDKQPLKTLSKSELEIIGLVVMISGYIINELRTKFPYIILDELTFLDPNRLSKFMSYILPYTESVILTKLPTGELAV